MRAIGKNIFETNSSSCHSIEITNHYKTSNEYAEKHSLCEKKTGLVIGWCVYPNGYIREIKN